MAYATQADLVPLRLTLEDLTELTSDSDDSGPDPVVVQAALDDASATVDSYCGQRYTLPLQTSSIVTRLTADLAIFDLASRRRDLNPKDYWVLRRDEAMALLKDVSSGRASLDQPATAAEPQGSSAEVTVPRHRQTFDDRHLRGFC